MLSEEEIRPLAYVLYLNKQKAPWYTAGNTPIAAIGDWLTAEEMLRRNELHDRVQLRAYYIWKKAGCPPDTAYIDWMKAYWIEIGISRLKERKLKCSSWHYS